MIRSLTSASRARFFRSSVHSLKGPQQVGLRARCPPVYCMQSIVVNRWQSTEIISDPLSVQQEEIKHLRFSLRPEYTPLAEFDRTDHAQATKFFSFLASRLTSQDLGVFVRRVHKLSGMPPTRSDTLVRAFWSIFKDLDGGAEIMDRVYEFLCTSNFDDDEGSDDVAIVVDDDVKRAPKDELRNYRWREMVVGAFDDDAKHAPQKSPAPSKEYEGGVVTHPDPDVQLIARSLIELRAIAETVLGRYVPVVGDPRPDQIYHNIVDVAVPLNTLDEIREKVEFAFIDHDTNASALQIAVDLKESLPASNFEEAKLQLLNLVKRSCSSPNRLSSRDGSTHRARNMHKLHEALEHHWLYFGPRIYRFLQVYDQSTAKVCPFSEVWNKWMNDQASIATSSLLVARSYQITHDLKESLDHRVSDATNLESLNKLDDEDKDPIDSGFQLATLRKLLSVKFNAKADDIDSFPLEGDQTAEEQMDWLWRTSFFRNLPTDATEEGLRQALRGCGEIRKVKLFNRFETDPKSNPKNKSKKAVKKAVRRETDTYALVEFEDEKSALAVHREAVRVFGIHLNDRNLRPVIAPKAKRLFLYLLDGTMITTQMEHWLNAMLSPHLFVHTPLYTANDTHKIFPAICKVQFPSHFAAKWAYEKLMTEVENGRSPVALNIQWFEVDTTTIEAIEQDRFTPAMKRYSHEIERLVEYHPRQKLSTAVLSDIILRPKALQLYPREGSKS